MQLSGMLPSFQPSLSNYIPSDGNLPIAAAQQGVFGQHGTTMGSMLPYNTSQFPGSLPFNAMGIPPNIGMGYVYGTLPPPAAAAAAQYGISSGVTQTTTSTAISLSSSSSSSSSVPPPAAAAVAVAASQQQPSPDGAMVGLGHPVHRTVSFPSQSQQVVLAHSSTNNQNMAMQPTVSAHTRNLSDGQVAGRNYIPQRSQSNIEVQHVEAAMAAWNKKELNAIQSDPYQGIVELSTYPSIHQARMVMQEPPIAQVEGAGQTVRRDPKHSGPRLTDETLDHSVITGSVQPPSKVPPVGESGAKVGVQQGVVVEVNVPQEGSLKNQQRDLLEASGQIGNMELDPPSDHTPHVRNGQDRDQHAASTIKM